MAYRVDEYAGTHIAVGALDLGMVVGTTYLLSQALRADWVAKGLKHGAFVAVPAGLLKCVVPISVTERYNKTKYNTILISAPGIIFKLCVHGIVYGFSRGLGALFPRGTSWLQGASATVAVTLVAVSTARYAFHDKRT